MAEVLCHLNETNIGFCLFLTSHGVFGAGSMRFAGDGAICSPVTAVSKILSTSVIVLFPSCHTNPEIAHRIFFIGKISFQEF